MKYRICAAVLLLLLAFAPNARAQTTLTVSAAASLKDVLSGLGARYEKAHPGRAVRFNFASSGTLQRQIEAGAPVDLFISAADKQMNELASQKLIDTATRRVLAGNALVLIVPQGSAKGIRSFRQLSRADISVAIGEPESVPAGKYAQQVLERVGVWRAVAGKAVRGRDVREVLAQVALGNVDAGIVYRSDAAIRAVAGRVKIVAVAPTALHAPIRYPIAVVTDSANAAFALDFERFLLSTTGRRALHAARFTLP